MAMNYVLTWVSCDGEVYADTIGVFDNPQSVVHALAKIMYPNSFLAMDLHHEVLKLQRENDDYTDLLIFFNDNDIEWFIISPVKREKVYFKNKSERSNFYL